jgi:glycerophosphoryl diester phosphodiesterase
MTTRSVEIIAHRGASFDAPENTLAALRLAWQQGADAVEFDVFLSKDGQIVLLHDKDLKRTAGDSRNVADLTLAELRKLEVGRWKDPRFAGEPIPTLAEALALTPAGKRVYIEIKCGPEIMPELKRDLKAAALKPEQTALIAFSADVIAQAKRTFPDLQAYWIVDIRKKRKPPWTAQRLIAKAREIKADALDVSAHDSITPQFAKLLRDARLPLYVWTVNDPALARQMIAAGAVGVTTDRPQWLREQLGK